MHRIDLAERARRDRLSHPLDERVTAAVVAARGDDACARGRLRHLGRLGRGNGKGLLADDVAPVLEREQRLFGVRGVRRADVQHVGPLRLEQPREVVVRRRVELVCELSRRRPAADGGDGDAELAQRERVYSRDVPRADDRGALAHSRCDALNMAVSTSMSSRACSGGVRHAAASVTHAWKWSSSRENASS